jgi:hypothetical protein
MRRTPSPRGFGSRARRLPMLLDGNGMCQIFMHGSRSSRSEDQGAGQKSHMFRRSWLYKSSAIAERNKEEALTRHKPPLGRHRDSANSNPLLSVTNLYNMKLTGTGSISHQALVALSNDTQLPICTACGTQYPGLVKTCSSRFPQSRPRPLTGRSNM